MTSDGVELLSLELTTYTTSISTSDTGQRQVECHGKQARVLDCGSVQQMDLKNVVTCLDPHLKFSQHIKRLQKYLRAGRLDR